MKKQTEVNEIITYCTGQIFDAYFPDFTTSVNSKQKRSLIFINHKNNFRIDVFRLMIRYLKGRI